MGDAITDMTGLGRTMGGSTDGKAKIGVMTMKAVMAMKELGIPFSKRRGGRRKIGVSGGT